MTVRHVLRRAITVFAICGFITGMNAGAASAEPGVEPVAVDAPPPEAVPPPEGAVDVVPAGSDDVAGRLDAHAVGQDEKQSVIAPLTTAISTREYEVGGIFNGSLTGPEEPEPPQGTLEVGYQIGCGIDMSTSNGVSLTGTAGINPSIGIIGTDIISPIPEGILPGIGGNLGGGITVGLKPGIINIVPVTKKDFEGADPWVMISGFRIKIDGCVGESFIRSYAFLTRSTAMSDAIVAWYGVTKKV